jgi:hypothetical protein
VGGPASDFTFVPFCVIVGWRGVEWIHFAQDGDQWQAVVNLLMNL